MNVTSLVAGPAIPNPSLAFWSEARVAQPGRAVLFGLDDTLYRERRFAISGFTAVAARLESAMGIPARRSLPIMLDALRRGARGTAFQAVCRECGVDASFVDDLQQVFRAHLPQLRLPRSSQSVLRGLRGQWRTAILTNGRPSVQARKVRALGLQPAVDAIFYASELGGRVGKPDPRTFMEAAHRLDVDPSSCVFVGHDILCDVAGARRVGMRTIRVRRYDSAVPTFVADADVVVDSLSDVPAVLASAFGQVMTWAM